MGLRWLWLSSNFDASRHKFLTIWPPSASQKTSWSQVICCYKNALTNDSIVSRARHCVQGAQIVILDAQNSSEFVNLDAQIVLLDTQNQSIGIQLVDFENWFQIWRMKSKRVCPNRFWKCIQMQIRCTNCSFWWHFLALNRGLLDNGVSSLLLLLGRENPWEAVAAVASDSHKGYNRPPLTGTVGLFSILCQILWFNAIVYKPPYISLYFDPRSLGRPLDPPS